MTENEVAKQIVDAAYGIHTSLGPGLLESAYEECLCRELDLKGVLFERQKPLPLAYKGIALECGYRLDVLVEGRIIIEIKSVEILAPIHEAQILTYLKLARMKVGLLINFNVPILKGGIKRFVV